jgi:hypothetical protein
MDEIVSLSYIFSFEFKHLLAIKNKAYADRKSALIPQPLLPRGEKRSKRRFWIFLVPLSQRGRGARGEGLKTFCVT